MYAVLIKAGGGCPWCDKAVAVLAEKSLPHTVVPCDSWAGVADYLSKRGLSMPRTKTFPQIVFDTTLLGGYDKLCDAIDEPILNANPLRFTLFPLEYPDLFDFYKKSVASFWTPDEVSLAQDVTDWKQTMSADERHFIKHILAFFAGSDGIVMENLAANFAKEVQIPEARQFYASQMLMEAIHSHQYALLIDALADPKEALTLFRAIKTVPAVRAKAAWAQKWMHPARRFAERLVAFVCVEGILFSGRYELVAESGVVTFLSHFFFFPSCSFCSIFWLKRRGVMPGLTLSNEFISRDEGLHYSFGCALYKKLRHRLTEDTIASIVREAVDTELAFVTDAIPCRLVGMNADLMQQYIKFVADRAMVDLGYSKLYGEPNPFPWMELISLQGKTNFFEQMPSQYQRAGVLGPAAEHTFGLDGEF